MQINVIRILLLNCILDPPYAFASNLARLACQRTEQNLCTPIKMYIVFPPIAVNSEIQACCSATHVVLSYALQLTCAYYTASMSAHVVTIITWSMLHGTHGSQQLLASTDAKTEDNLWPCEVHDWKGIRVCIWD